VVKEENFMKLTDLEAAVFYGLMRNYEGHPYGGWARTDSNNARMTSGVEGSQFAEALASLAEKGLYRNAGDDVYVIEEVFADGEPCLYTEDEAAA
jgi:hypothetical protein